MEYLLMKKLSVILLAIFIVTISGCKSTIPLHNYMNEKIVQYGQNTSTVESVERAIVKAGLLLGWKIDIQEQGKILATLDIRKHQLVVLITHDDKEFSIKYKDSTNLKYNGYKIHRQYANWVTNLIRTINAQNITG